MARNFRMICIVLLSSIITGTDCTETCKSLIPLDAKLCDIEGLWFWTMATGDCIITDCSGFFGQMINERKGYYRATGRPGMNAQFEVEIANREFVIKTRDEERRVTTFKYRAALIESSFICFYTCGAKGRYDDAQCFSRNHCVTELDRTRIYCGLRHFGLILADTDLKLINRQGCVNMGKRGYGPRC